MPGILDSLIEAGATVGSESQQNIVVENNQTDDQNTQIIDQNTNQDNQKTDFDLATFNSLSKNLGKEFATLDEAKEFYNIPTKYTEEVNTHNLTKKERDELKSQYEEATKKYNEVGKFVNPRDFFADEESFKANQLKIKFPGKDPDTIEKIIRLDLNKTDYQSQVERLALKEMLTDGDIYGDIEKAKKYLAEEIYKDVDLSDPDSWDDMTKIKIAKKDKKIRAEFKDDYQAIQLPEKIDIEARKAELIAEQEKKYEVAKTGLRNYNAQLLTKNPPLTFPDPENPQGEPYIFQPKVTKELESALERFADSLAREGKDLSNNETVNEIALYREMWLTHRHAPEIWKARELHVAKVKAEQYHNKVHNDNPLSTKTAPIRVNTDDGEAQRVFNFVRQKN